MLNNEQKIKRVNFIKNQISIEFNNLILIKKIFEKKDASTHLEEIQKQIQGVFCRLLDLENYFVFCSELKKNNNIIQTFLKLQSIRHELLFISTTDLYLTAPAPALNRMIKIRKTIRQLQRYLTLFKEDLEKEIKKEAS